MRPRRESSAAAGASTALSKRHGIATRAWHWLNFLCLIVLLMSGLQIFNARPDLYWGARSAFNNPLLAIGMVRGPDGDPRGVTAIAGHRFNTTGVLGLSTFNGRPAARAFPAWATLPSAQWLSMGRTWHFAAAWVFAPSLFLYLAYSLLSRRRRRRIGPSAAQWRGLPRTVVDHLRLRFPPHTDYNGLQKLTYLVVLFGLLPLMVATGLTMSPTVDANWPWLLTLFDGRQSARTIHFFCAFALLAFFVIHVVLVLVSGVVNNMRSMITGGYRVRAAAEREPEDKP